LAICLSKCVGVHTSVNFKVCVQLLLAACARDSKWANKS
jgi:hypothetical protein